MAKINIANDETVSYCVSSDMMQHVVYTISPLTHSNCKCLILTQDFRAVLKY